MKDRVRVVLFGSTFLQFCSARLPVHKIRHLPLININLLNVHELVKAVIMWDAGVFHLCSSCRLSAAFLSHSCTQHRLFYWCRSARIHHYPLHTSLLLKHTHTHSMCTAVITSLMRTYTKHLIIHPHPITILNTHTRSQIPLLLIGPTDKICSLCWL